MENTEEKEPIYYYYVNGVKYHTSNLEFSRVRSQVHGEE